MSDEQQSFSEIAKYPGFRRIGIAHRFIETETEQNAYQSGLHCRTHGGRRARKVVAHPAERIVQKHSFLDLQFRAEKGHFKSGTAALISTCLATSLCESV